jgi:hypothetical protein
VDACTTTSDCTGGAICAFSYTPDGCDICWPKCDGGACQGENSCASDADCNASPDARCVCDDNGCTLCVLGIF